MLTPVDYFRHGPTSHRLLKEIVDLPSFMKLFDPFQDFYLAAMLLSGRNVNCPIVPLALSTQHHRRS